MIETLLTPTFLKKLGGLDPQAWICVGPGFAREELKRVLLEQGCGFVSHAITSIEDLCLRIVAASRGPLEARADRVLGSFARQEILRSLLAERRINVHLPELKRLRRQSGFFKKLDRAVQSGRSAFAHTEEEAVLSERLDAKLGPNLIRAEVRTLAASYEAWLDGSSLWDPPLLMRRALDCLSARDLPAEFVWPEKVVYLSAQYPESLEQEFWSTLARFTTVQRVGPLDDTFPSETREGSTSPNVRPGWERWHTLDDAAASLAERLAALPPEELESQVILIPDLPAVRRSVRESLENFGIPLADPRDPTLLRTSEAIKWALLPLGTVSRDFERTQVIAFLRGYFFRSEFPKWVTEIHARGIRQGLKSYAGSSLEEVSSRLQELQKALGGKRTCAELSDGFLSELRVGVGEEEDRSWLVPFFERTMKDLVSDVERVGLGRTRAPARFWLERLNARLEEATPPVERFKPEQGVVMHRLGQALLKPARKLWILGFPPGWLSAQGAGDYWFSERERELLGGEFAIRCAAHVRKERIAVLNAWLRTAESIELLDAEYDWDGRERESLLPALRELAVDCEDFAPVVQGAHPRWSRSFGALRPLPPLEVRLPSLTASGKREIRATELDHYSRCAFRGMAAGRWRVWDLKEPGPELWPEVRGNILHLAIRLLLEARGENGEFTRTASDALEEAWSEERPKGLYAGERLKKYVKKKLLGVLESFLEQEKKYFERSGARIQSLEGPPLRLDYEDFSVIGIPDRVDVHPEGIFVMDYKSSSALPSGQKMLELGYRLQLPFYALAAQKQLGKPAIGVQFVELNRNAGRGKGIFFKKWNGKEAGKLTHSRSKQNVLEMEPDAAWSQSEEHLVRHARGYLEGNFTARPKEETECRSCPFGDLCGYRRKGAEEEGALE